MRFCQKGFMCRNNKLEEMREHRVDEEGRKQFLKELSQKGIVTEDALDTLLLLKNFLKVL